MEKISLLNYQRASCCTKPFLSGSIPHVGAAKPRGEFKEKCPKDGTWIILEQLMACQERQNAGPNQQYSPNSMFVMGDSGPQPA